MPRGCDILAQGLIGLIGYSYQQVATSFPEANLQRTLRLSVLGPEKLRMGDRPRSSSRVRTSEDKVCRKDLCWSVRAAYILDKLSDVSGPGLGKAGCYIMVSMDSPTRTSVSLRG